MKISNSKKYLIFVIIFWAMSICVLVVLYSQIATNKKIANKLEAQWQGEVITQGKIKTLERSINEINKERDSFESHFARSSDVVPFLDTVEDLATKVSAKANISTVDITDNPAGLVIGVNATGTFDAVYKFMMLLENSPYELEIAAFDLRRDLGDSTASWVVTLRVKVLSFTK